MKGLETTPCEVWGHPAAPPGLRGHCCEVPSGKGAAAGLLLCMETAENNGFINVLRSQQAASPAPMEWLR